MSEFPSNGHPHPDSKPDSKPDATLLPRIATPPGQRAARGVFADQTEGETDDLTEIEADSDALTLVEGAADSPAVEDIYEPPLGLSTAIEPEDESIYDYELATGSSGGGNGNGGSNSGGGLFGSGGKRDDTPKDVELGLMDHLNELRVRLLWCVAILAVGMTLTWNYSPTLQTWFAAPIQKVIAGSGKIQIIDPTESFSIALQFSAVSALILTAPLLFWQIWRFIEPALTNSERRYSLVLVPFASVLFFMGAGLGFAVSPLFFKFFLQFLPKGVEANWQYSASIVLMAKMLLVFGVMFEVPVVIIFLNKLGIVSRNLLIEYWRHAVVLIFIVVAILTPTWDPVTMTVCAVPPCLLYVLSIWLVKWL